MAELLIGCGARRGKFIHPQGGNPEFTDLTTLDINRQHNPDVVWDLNKRPLPFDDEAFDEIHAYEVIEHLGRGIGDWRSWFAEWSEWWRLLKPGGVFCGTSPSLKSRWVFGDPSHRRAVSAEMLTFLVQPEYTKQVGVTPMSDFRFCYGADFTVQFTQEDREVFVFVLEAVKPSRLVLQ